MTHVYAFSHKFIFPQIILSHFVAKDFMRFCWNPCWESFFSLPGVFFSFPCLSQNLSSTPGIGLQKGARSLFGIPNIEKGHSKLVLSVSFLVLFGYFKLFLVLFSSLGFLLVLFLFFFIVFGSLWFCLVLFGYFTFCC